MGHVTKLLSQHSRTDSPDRDADCLTLPSLTLNNASQAGKYSKSYTIVLMITKCSQCAVFLPLTVIKITSIGVKYISSLLLLPLFQGQSKLIENKNSLLATP